MKPNELRLGNFVKIQDNGALVRVCAITKRKIGFHYGNDNTRMYYRKYCEIEPLLIHDVYDKLNCPTLNWHDNSDTYYYGGFSLCKGVKYLHELQNLYFAMTGEELIFEV